jgi:lysophospholipase L1-like esterase
MLGTNDSKKRNWNADKYQTDLVALAQSYLSLPTKPAVYLMIPPRVEATEKVTKEYGMQPKIINTIIPGIIRKVAAAEEHVSVIDLSKLFLNPSKPSYIPQRGDPRYWSSDGVHPNDAAYEKVAQYIYEHLT